MACEFVPLLDGVGYVRIGDGGGFSARQVLGTPEEAVLVDTYYGGEHAAELIACLEGAGFRPRSFTAIVITHGHEDHHGGAAELAAWSGAPLWAHPYAAAQMEDPEGYWRSAGSWVENIEPGQWRTFRARSGPIPRVDRLLREGDRFACAGHEWGVLHAPGHDRGELVLHDADRRIVLTGDLVQGGMDAAGNWLGLFTDAAAQRASLQRVAALDPAWNFKGHRCPRQGAELQQDLSCALARLDAIERAVLAALAGGQALGTGPVARAVLATVLGQRVETPPAYAWTSVQCFLFDLARRGLVRRTPDHDWALAR